jgi:uncharacterized protein (TIGR00159 family)
VAIMLDGLKPIDLVDILAVAAFVYGALVWFKQARSRFVLMGVAALGSVYFVAQYLGLRLTLRMFEASLAIVVFCLVIIFQEEIRRFFERIATSGLFRWRQEQHGPTTEVIDTVVEGLVKLAKKRVGALVVFKGHEPLDRHLTGGQALNGKVSFPLIDSIFDTSSAGHDGAVVIDAGTVTSFGVHLPLSKRVGDKAFGTRHTAALGLSECSDAMVLVVSEERGEISVAHDRAIEVVKEPAELKARLVAFHEHLAPQSPVSLWRRLLVQNPGAKILSVAIAFIMWATTFGGDQGETIRRTYTVPVTVSNPPEGMSLDETSPDEATVTLSGPEGEFRDLDEHALELRVDIDHISAGVQHLRFDPASIIRPRALEVARIDPPELTVRAHETVKVRAEVRPRTKGSLPRSLKIRALKVEPTYVGVVVAKTREASAKQVHTEPIDLGAITKTGTLTITRRVQPPEGVELVDGENSSVTVTVEVEPAVAQTRFEGQAP